MADYQHPVQSDLPSGAHEPSYNPYWARSHCKYAQNLLECSDEPIEYDHDDRDYWDNSFFFPEDCFWSPSKYRRIDDRNRIDHETTYRDDTDTDTMIPGLPDIKMLDAEALGDLLEDNLSPPEITSILVFATNGAIFAYASDLPTRQLRNLSATYGAAYTCYAKTASSGNLTGVNPASHPSSYVTAQSVSLGDVGSIVFELDDLVAVVTRIADKVLLAAVGPSKSQHSDSSTQNGITAPPKQQADPPADPSKLSSSQTPTPTNGTPNSLSRTHSEAATPQAQTQAPSDAHLETQYQIDRNSNLSRLASLNLNASPSILLALESKSAALGRFLGQKLEDLESPEDF